MRSSGVITFGMLLVSMAAISALAAPHVLCRRTPAKQRSSSAGRRDYLINPLPTLLPAGDRRRKNVLAGVAQPPASTTKIVTDQLGRTVVLPGRVQRVVSLAPAITEIIFALERESYLKGVTRYSDYPPAARRLPRVGSYVALDLEKIVAARPDLCIAVKEGTPKRVIDRLESLGIPVFAAHPNNLATVMETISAIGGLLGARENADRLTAAMRTRIRAVAEQVARTSRRPRVFFQIGTSPIVAVGTHTYIHELIELAGGLNLTAGEHPYPRFSREQVIALSPDIIIITAMTKDDLVYQVLAEWNRWPQIPAVRNRRIYIEDPDLFDRPTPRLVDGLEALVRRIHPELTGKAPP